jgi:hypothetical protein
VVFPIVVVTLLFIFGFVGKESDTPNGGNGRVRHVGPVLRPGVSCPFSVLPSVKRY